MRAVWSFWSAPFLAHKHSTWCKPVHHLLSWGLSFRAAKRHFEETALVTDEAGKALLVDQLGLPFDSVSTELECLAGVDPDWWALGKLVTYSLQDRPFVHIDSDVFLWNPLPARLLEAPVIAQNPEYPYHHPVSGPGGPRDIEEAFAREGLELPPEWLWARSQDDSFFPEENCGIVGGNEVAFLRYYSRLAIDLVMNPAHRAAWDRLGDKKAYNMIVEQFLLSACVGYHRFHPRSPFKEIRIKHLFPGFAEACDSGCTARAGFTHLMGDAKAHPAIGQRLEERLRREDPTFFRLCAQLA